MKNPVARASRFCVVGWASPTFLRGALIAEKVGNAQPTDCRFSATTGGAAWKTLLFRGRGDNFFICKGTEVRRKVVSPSPGDNPTPGRVLFRGRGDNSSARKVVSPSRGENCARRKVVSPDGGEKRPRVKVVSAKRGDKCKRHIQTCPRKCGRHVGFASLNPVPIDSCGRRNDGELPRPNGTKACSHGSVSPDKRHLRFTSLRRREGLPEVQRSFRTWIAIVPSAPHEVCRARHCLVQEL
jgi:hypothetical protein